MESSMAPEETEWHRIEEVPDEGRVFTRIVDGRSVALTRCGGRLGALENHCPHQGGPLGEGSIENGWLRCPWHGYDYDPTTGTPPEGFSDAPHAFEVREDGDGAYVALPDVRPNGPRSVSDVVVETLVAWGVDTVFGMVGHSNLGFAEALRRAEERGEMRYIGIRHEGAAAFAASGVRQAHRAAGGLLRDRRSGLDEPTHRPVRRQAGRGAGARHLRPGAVEGARQGRLPGPRLVGGVPRRRHCPR